MLLAENIKVSFDGFVAVNGISLNVGKGEVVGLLGANGAGKSTTMKTLAGVIPPTSGEIFIDDIKLNDVKQGRMAKQFIGYCPDVGGLAPGSTPRDHIQLLYALRENTVSTSYSDAIQLVNEIGLGGFIDTQVGGFSHGMSRRLSVLLAALASTKVLILDEPFDGVDPVGVEIIIQIIRKAQEKGLCVLISTHLQSLLCDATDRVLIINKGKILDEYPSSKLKGVRGVNKYKKLLETDNKKYGNEQTENSKVLESHE